MYTLLLMIRIQQRGVKYVLQVRPECLLQQTLANTRKDMCFSKKSKIKNDTPVVTYG